MTCHDKEIAARVLSYQELSPEDRGPVDSHVAECDECAQTFWALDRFVHRLHKSGEERRMGLIHPREEQIIQLAVDPKLLAAEERAKIQRHFERDKCADCERIYWSVLENEKVVKDSTAAILQGGRALQQLDAILNRFELHKPLIIICALVLIALVVAPYVALWFTLLHLHRITKSLALNRH